MAIPIEERSETDVLGGLGRARLPPTRHPQEKKRYRAAPEKTARYMRIASPFSPALNPGFDITPAELPGEYQRYFLYE